eukprot:CAMPEP_0169317742 /NCGR_PEP_ID=MMETSP1017-20121227/6883_1 /TAXON_ID=342587 /ORGANISM="Karlodinium micrum, Strain CCMP2283" /LENGTH=133 /DNA_ID=CAMNT_0009411907 /DNA_START=597 /DNA_END=998 /DNA_ORIENTATION=-
MALRFWSGHSNKPASSRRPVLPSPPNGEPIRVFRKTPLRSTMSDSCASIAALASATSAALRTPLTTMYPFKSKKNFSSPVIPVAIAAQSTRALFEEDCKLLAPSGDAVIVIENLCPVGPDLERARFVKNGYPG